ncbi:putative bifunctional diguanylate cyclase/phosphodiesterase [Shewanella waksmanii]|uniref:putative bifunctional diguanylate cyclase/phosphodiesterase n=1 Tax=Shewanella waksmanii TaxID=213783 RepID=UPI00373679D5
MNTASSNAFTINHFRELIEQFPLPIAIINTKGIIHVVNQRWRNFSCFKHLNIAIWTGINYLNIYQNEQDRQSQNLQLEIDRLINQEVDFIRLEYLSFQKHRERCFQLSATRLVIGDETYLFAIHEEVLNRSELLDSQERLAIAAEAAEIGIWDYQIDSQSLIWDDWMYKLYDVNPQQTSATFDTWADAIHPDDAAKALHSFQDAIANAKNFNGEFRIVRGDGEVRTIQASAKVITDQHNKAIRFIGSNIDITDVETSKNKIHELAYFDQLTNLPNRRLLKDRLMRSLAVSRRLHFYGAVLFIDLDNFKEINDIHGHDLGDEVLTEIAARLSNAIGIEDTLSRWSGDEFTILLPHISLNERIAVDFARTTAESIQNSLSQVIVSNGCMFKLTACIGITLFNHVGTTCDEALKQADLALYRSKDSGKNHISFFDPAMQTDILNRKQMEIDLENACLNGEFTLYYQAQFSDDNGIIGAETLIRWQHPQKGLVRPDEFIPVLEETGLIIEVGKWVLSEACAKLGAWAKQPLFSHMTLSVNVSSVQLLDRNFTLYVKQLIDIHQVPKGKLKIEITEGIFIDNIDTTVAIMDELSDSGIIFSLDDFGTGFSSLSYLKSLPLSQLKIDKSFVRDLQHDENDVAISKTIVNLAQSLDLNVIAEGVEQNEQRQILRNLGCYNYQGYLYHKPESCQQFEQFVRQQQSHHHQLKSTA